MTAVKLFLCAALVVPAIWCQQWIFNHQRQDTSDLAKIVMEPSQKYRFFVKCPKDSGVESVEYIAEHRLETDRVCRGQQ